MRPMRPMPTRNIYHYAEHRGPMCGARGAWGQCFTREQLPAFLKMARENRALVCRQCETLVAETEGRRK